MRFPLLGYTGYPLAYIHTDLILRSTSCEMPMERRFLLLVLVLVAGLLAGSTGEQQPGRAVTAEHPAVGEQPRVTAAAASCDPLCVAGAGAPPSATAATGDASTPPPPRQLDRPNRDLPTIPTPSDHGPVPTPPSPISIDYAAAPVPRTITHRGGALA
ncbi:hypothetical protein E2562_027257 [Oryza meyeriana var. granulata]|uniref:Uncharacterized protein n=1 Tax=Oryza meyeriana var. granulata TaxID=110450 RepID=A0A6G1C994_9ORYZ|nr:hypothetical protein E2562_027257 [Oryza meyeriana var. granulata]